MNSLGLKKTTDGASKGERYSGFGKPTTKLARSAHHWEYVCLNALAGYPLSLGATIILPQAHANVCPRCAELDSLPPVSQASDNFKVR